MSDERAARFNRDRERILGSRAFRRLAGKTQVVSLPNDPLVRTRLTHTLEVASIARELARGLAGNDQIVAEPLVEAIALAHDLGHPAFGHAGEKALATIVPGGFHHAAHGVRVVTELEPELDLAPETVEGVLKHSKGKGGAVFGRGGGLASVTREALIVRAADLYAYACHDLDDAYLLGALQRHDLPAKAVRVLGAEPSDVRRVLVDRTVQSSSSRGDISLDAETDAALQELRAFLYERLYEAPRLQAQTASIRALVGQLWESASERPFRFQSVVGQLRLLPPAADDLGEAFVDAVAAMTDRQVLDVCRSLRLPRRVWSSPAPSWRPTALRDSSP
jgi:dGTPase